MKVAQRSNFTREEESVVHPRRSSRLLNNCHTAKDPHIAIPKCDNNAVHPKTLLLSEEKGSRKKSLKRCPQRSSQLCKESETQAIASPRSNTGLCVRRSPRFATHVDNQALGDKRKEALSNMVKAGDNNCSYRIEKRLTRGSSKNKGNESTRIDCEGTSLASSAKKGIDERKKAPPVEKNKTKGKCSASLADVERVQMMGSNKVRQPIEVKRKRNEEKETHGVNELWTNDQEQALQKAYFAMKPTPHFWKKVANLVVGKSAQECFDKVQADHLSPLPRPKRRMTINPIKPSSLSISTSNFLSPIGEKKRKSKIKKTNAQKAVRKLLQQHDLENQVKETDLFSTLEGSTVARSLKRDCIMDMTPQALLFDDVMLPVGRGGGGGSAAKSLVSPLVLKQVKNTTLHEKYIDKLHQREAKRQAADKLSKKSGLKRKGKGGVVQVLDAVKMAKDALVLGASNVAKELKRLDGNNNDDDDDDDDDSIDGFHIHREENEDDEL